MDDPVKVFSGTTLVIQTNTLIDAIIAAGGNDLAVVESDGVLASCRILSGGSAVFSGGYGEYLDVSSGGQVIVSGGSTEFRYALISDNIALYEKTVQVLSAGASFVGCVVSGNTMEHISGLGGLVAAYGTPNQKLSMYNTHFIENNADPSNGIDSEYIIGGALCASGIHLSLNYTEFTGNSVIGVGAGAAILDCDTIISSCNFTGNIGNGACLGGGGLYVSNHHQSGSVVVSCCKFYSNNFIANDYAGAVYGGGAAMLSLSSSGRLSLEHTVFSGNHVERGEAQTSMAVGGAMVLCLAESSTATCGALDFYNNYVHNYDAQTNGMGGGGGAVGMLSRDSVALFGGCMFNSNYALTETRHTGHCGAYGGAMLIENSGSRDRYSKLSLKYCQFTNNLAIASADNASARVVGSVVGGAVAFKTAASNAMCDIVSCFFGDNHAEFIAGAGSQAIIFFISGGAVGVTDATELTISGGTFRDNTIHAVLTSGMASYQLVGGAVAGAKLIDSAVFLNNCIALESCGDFKSARTDGELRGGAVYAASGAVIKTCLFSGNYISGLKIDQNINTNTAAKGGAVYLAGDAIISNTFFSGNSAVSDDAAMGGALYLAGGSAVFIYNNASDSLLCGSNIYNSATDGGFLYLARGTSASFNIEQVGDIYFTGNQADSGGVFYLEENAEITFNISGCFADICFTGNQADSGGVFYLEKDADVIFNIGKFTSCFFSGNVANAGGCMYINGGTVTFNTASTGWLRLGSSQSDTDSIAGSGTIEVNGHIAVGCASGFTGEWHVWAGGELSANTVSNIRISSAGEFYLYGSAGNATVEAGGKMTTAGKADGIDVFGTLQVGRGCITQNTTIHSGGLLFIESSYSDRGFDTKLSGVVLEQGALLRCGDYLDVSCAGSAASATLSTSYRYYYYGFSSYEISSGRNLAVDGYAKINGLGYDFEVTGWLELNSGAVLSGVILSSGGMKVYSGGQASGVTLGSGTSLTIMSGAYVNEVSVDNGSSFLIIPFDDVPRMADMVACDNIRIADGATLVCRELYSATIRVSAYGSGDFRLDDDCRFHSATILASYYNSSKYRAAAWDDHANIRFIGEGDYFVYKADVYNMVWSFGRGPYHNFSHINGDNSCIEVVSGGFFEQGSGTLNHMIIRSGGKLQVFPGWSSSSGIKRAVCTDIIVESGGYIGNITCNKFADSGLCEIDSTGRFYPESGSASYVIPPSGITSGRNLLGSGAEWLIGSAERISWQSSDSVLSIASGANLTDLELLDGAVVIIESGARVGGGLAVDLAGHTADGGASVRNLASLDGVTLTVNADSLSADCGTFILVSGVTAESITVSLAGTAYD
ncbi:MAG: hypothetical protein AB7F40_02735, partial [Victivallaceae bacterium]